MSVKPHRVSITFHICLIEQNVHKSTTSEKESRGMKREAAMPPAGKRWKNGTTTGGGKKGVFCLPPQWMRPKRKQVKKEAEWYNNVIRINFVKEISIVVRVWAIVAFCCLHSFCAVPISKTCARQVRKRNTQTFFETFVARHRLTVCVWSSPLLCASVLRHAKTYCLLSRLCPTTTKSRSLNFFH